MLLRLADCQVIWHWSLPDGLGADSIDAMLTHGSLRLESVVAESLTSVQIRRVNAQYLLDLIGSSLGSIACEERVE